MQAGLDHVAVDGAKLRASASKHKQMSYERMVRAEADLAAEVQGWLDRAGSADDAEDAEHGPKRRGDEMPDWMADKQRRLARIRAAKAELEAEAQLRQAAKPDPGTKADGTKAKPRGRKPSHPPGTPDPAQRNFTDPQSRIMLGRDGFIQAYNGQAAVDGKAQIIVAHRLTANASDQDGLLPLIGAATVNTGRKPAELRPTTASAPKPISLASSSATFAAMWRRGAPNTLPMRPSRPNSSAAAAALS